MQAQKNHMPGSSSGFFIFLFRLCLKLKGCIIEGSVFGIGLKIPYTVCSMGPLTIQSSRMTAELSLALSLTFFLR